MIRAGKECCWELSARSLHIGDYRMMVIHCTWEQMPCPYSPTVTEKPHLGVALLSPKRMGEIKGCLNNAHFKKIPGRWLHLSCYLTSEAKKLKTKQNTHPIFGAWNIWTLMDKVNRPEHHTAIVAKMLNWYQVDTAALSETRVAGETQIDGVRGGFTFYYIGKPHDSPRISGVGFDHLHHNCEKAI